MSSSDYDKTLFNKYYKALCYFAWQMVNDTCLAEDLAQDAFVSFYQNKVKVSPDEIAIKSFLYSSVKFAVYNRSRKNKTIQKYWQRNVYTEADDTDYEQLIIRAEFTAELESSLADLPEGCRKIMTLSYMDGFSNEEIAKKLQVSINTVKTQKRRGLRVLRTSLRVDCFSLVLLFSLLGK